jgi:hypothetical protein
VAEQAAANFLDRKWPPRISAGQTTALFTENILDPGLAYRMTRAFN